MARKSYTKRRTRKTKPAEIDKARTPPDGGNGKPPVKDDLHELDCALQEARCVIEVATKALEQDVEAAVVDGALVAGLEMLRAVEHRLDLLSIRLHREGCPAGGAS